jgi:hypothetical protein
VSNQKDKEAQAELEIIDCERNKSELIKDFFSEVLSLKKSLSTSVDESDKLISHKT